MWKKILVGLIVGFISGMFASGGGLLLIPAYIHFFDSSEKGNYINWKTGILCCIGGIIGSFIGSKLLAILKGKYLKLIFILFLIYSGIKIVFF